MVDNQVMRIAPYNPSSFYSIVLAKPIVFAAERSAVFTYMEKLVSRFPQIGWRGTLNYTFIGGAAVQLLLEGTGGRGKNVSDFDVVVFGNSSVRFPEHYQKERLPEFGNLRIQFFSPHHPFLESIEEDDVCRLIVGKTTFAVLRPEAIICSKLSRGRREKDIRDVMALLRVYKLNPAFMEDWAVRQNREPIDLDKLMAVKEDFDALSELAKNSFKKSG